MHAAAFDHLARTLFHAASRRAALGALLASAAGALVLGAPSPAAAQGCRPNGTRCQNNDACCSGLCKPKRRGNKPIKVCRQADRQGACSTERNRCGGTDAVCGTNNDGGFCHCFVTTTGRSFCGEDQQIQAGNCTCTSNQECEDRIGKKGAKCIDATACGCSSGVVTGCMAPCFDPDPVP